MPRPTLKDVALKAGVSYQTVSKVLNHQAQVAPETATRIWAAARELKYEPDLSARRLRAGSSQLIGYAWHHAPDNDVHPILDKFLHGAAYAAEGEGFHIFTFMVGEDWTNVKPYDELFSRRQVDGYVLADTTENDPRIGYLLEHNIPFASFGRANEAWDFCWVDIDGGYGMEKVVEHLLARGHRRIAMISWPEGSQSGWHRECGYIRGLAAAGLEPEPRLIWRGPNAARTGARAMTEFLGWPKDRRPSAIVCISDLIAIGALNAAAAAGLTIGRDVAITGFDDIPLAEYLHPPLTTVAQPITEAAQMVIGMVLKQIRGEPIAQRYVLLKPELVVRESS